MATGQKSLGMRLSQVNFFEGVIAKVRFTPALVDPKDFLRVPESGAATAICLGWLAVSTVAARKR